MKTSRITRAIFLLSLLTIYMSTANAQKEEDIPLEYRTVESIVPGTKGSYRCYKFIEWNKAIYVGLRYNDEAIRKEYPAWFEADPSFLGYKTDVHNAFVSLVREAIGMEKVRTLAGRNEQLYVGFDLDQNGKILMITFYLDTTTLVTTDELYSMEELIKARFTFVPIRRTSVKLGCGFSIGTTFGEILAGEIPSLKREEQQQRETEQDFGD
ncbi:MAG: hypothetical protein RBS81_11150 [Tenuifilaceae bacterium]|nr:hypothetical protein [Tenuifilaceae bacterium]